MTLGARIQHFEALLIQSDAEALETCVEEFELLRNDPYIRESSKGLQKELVRLRILAERSKRFYRGVLQMSCESASYTPLGLISPGESLTRFRWEA